MDRSDLRDWLAAYEAAWVDHDPEAAGRLFTADAEYHQTPFDVYEGRDEIAAYWARVTPNHEDITVTTEILGVDGHRGFVRFYAEYTNPDEVETPPDGMDPDEVVVRLDGLCIVTLEDGQCPVFREWWHRDP